MLSIYFQVVTQRKIKNKSQINELKMSAPSKANVVKLDNPARLKINHQAVTEPGV